MTTAAESIADRVANDHTDTVVAEDVQWFYGVCRRVERETRMELEPRIATLREFVAHTLDEYGDRMPSQWKAHARAVLVEDE